MLCSVAGARSHLPSFNGEAQVRSSKAIHAHHTKQLEQNWPFSYRFVFLRVVSWIVRVRPAFMNLGRDTFSAAC